MPLEYRVFVAADSNGRLGTPKHILAIVEFELSCKRRSIWIFEGRSLLEGILCGWRELGLLRQCQTERFTFLFVWPVQLVLLVSSNASSHSVSSLLKIMSEPSKARDFRSAIISQTARLELPNSHLYLPSPALNTTSHYAIACQWIGDVGIAKERSLQFPF